MQPDFIQCDVPLASLTTIGVGGSAEYLATCQTSEQLTAALGFAADRTLNVTVLGGGSNVVVADRGLSGVVICLAPVPSPGPAVSFVPDGDFGLWQVAGGVSWDALVARTVSDGYAGLECLSGIPGLVGAAPMQNIGAYGQEVSTTITAVWAVDRESGESERIKADACGFGYRTSHFKTQWRNRFVVTRVDFRLRRSDVGSTSYAGVADYLSTHNLSPSLSHVRRSVIEVRRSKSMVIDPADANSRSCGSFFTNPIVSNADADRVASLATSPPPRYVIEGGVKIPAAWLIEAAGFERGHAHGAVGLSTRHTLAIVNRGGATAHDVTSFARVISDTVHDRFGVSLVPEPVFLGDHRKS